MNRRTSMRRPFGQDPSIEAERFYEELVATAGRTIDEAQAGSEDVFSGWPGEMVTEEERRRADLFFADLTGQRPARRRRAQRFASSVAAEEAQEAARRVDPRATVRWVQRALNQVGPGSLAVDGFLGPRTLGALQRFQQARGIRADRRLLSTTLRPLAAASGTVPPEVWAGSPPTHQRRRPDLSTPCPGPATVLDGFVFRSSTPTAAHRAAIALLAQTIVASQSSSEPVHLVCFEGHTDSVGAYASNEVLGQRRADAIQAELVAAIDRSSPGLSQRLGFWSTTAGETAPAAPNDTDANRARNRRVEVCLNRRWQAPPSVTLVADGQATRDATSRGLVAQGSPETVRVAVGQRIGLMATGSPLPLGTPAYEWSQGDGTIVAISP